ncbi:MAG: hypothetical protein WKF83_05320 [Nocardioidaceae bacterium]
MTVGPDVSGPGEHITVDLTLALRDREPADPRSRASVIVLRFRRRLSTTG